MIEFLLEMIGDVIGEAILEFVLMPVMNALFGLKDMLANLLR